MLTIGATSVPGYDCSLEFGIAHAPQPAAGERRNSLALPPDAWWERPLWVLMVQHALLIIAAPLRAGGRLSAVIGGP